MLQDTLLQPVACHRRLPLNQKVEYHPPFTLPPSSSVTPLCKFSREKEVRGKRNPHHHCSFNSAFIWCCSHKFLLRSGCVHPITMAGVAIVLDLLRKNPNSYSTHSSRLFSATAAASAAAASVAAGTPFASRFLFGNARIPVAHCDAGADLPEDLIANIRRLPGNVFQPDSIKYTTKEYHFELKPLFSAFELRAFAMTTLRSFLMFYLPLLEPRTNQEEDDDEDFLKDTPEQRVDLVVPFKKSVKQIIRETTVVTTRRVLERMAVHYVSQRMAWKLLKDVPKSAMRKADRGMPTLVYFFKVSRTTFRGHFLGVAASWLVQVGIEVYRFCSGVINNKVESEDSDELDSAAQVKVLGKKISCVTVRCGSSLVFASIGAGIGAVLFRPSLGQWIGCAVGDLGGPVIVAYCLEKLALDRLYCPVIWEVR